MSLSSDSCLLLLLVPSTMAAAVIPDSNEQGRSVSMCSLRPGSCLLCTCVAGPCGAPTGISQALYIHIAGVDETPRTKKELDIVSEIFKVLSLPVLAVSACAAACVFRRMVSKSLSTW